MMDSPEIERKYWVVSQNVNSIPEIVVQWGRDFWSAKVAVMDGDPTNSVG
jgi:hypothetical protein